MPFFGGPVPAVLLTGVLIVALVLWLLRDRRHPGPRLHGADGIDREELEEAEREVRELEAGRLPDEEGWGTTGDRAPAGPVLPTRL